MALRGMLSAAGMLAFNRVCWLTRSWQAMPTGERVSQMCLPSMLKMELTALAACAQKRGAVFGQIVYTADSLANVYAHDERDWGKGSLRKALELCIAVLQTI